MKDLDGLIARVEQATGPDRELDFDLMCLCNSVAAQMTFKAANAAPDWYIPACTSSIDAALGLMEHVHGKAVMRRVYDDPDGYGVNCDIVLDNGDSIKVRGALTWPLAIILATLQALQSLPEGDVR